VKLLALDFDGVLSDSAPECFAVALATYVELRPSSRYAAVAEELNVARSRPGLLQRIQGVPFYGRFLQLMPLGNRAEDFGVALGILEAGSLVDEQAAYDREWEAAGEDFRKQFHERFYLHRAGFAAAHEEAWLGLLASYPEFLALLHARQQDVTLAIATAKDRPTVLTLLSRYGVEALFEDELILDKDAGVSKRAHLAAIAERSGLPLREMTFVDDKVNHLDSVASLGVRCALAGWGYNGDRERALARQRSYLVCDLSDAEAQLFG
jgi:phosphoglycolate phosphatase-like HAD superfamily hydrolase